MPKRATRPATGKGNQVNHLEVSRVPACSMTTTTPVVFGSGNSADKLHAVPDTAQLGKCHKSKY
jgi:hypothetical protein